MSSPSPTRPRPATVGHVADTVPPLPVVIRPSPERPAPATATSIYRRPNDTLAPASSSFTPANTPAANLPAALNAAPDTTNFSSTAATHTHHHGLPLPPLPSGTGGSVPAPPRQAFGTGGGEGVITAARQQGQGGGNPARAINAARRGRAIALGGPQGGGQAPTPGNTPSSLENISRRIVKNLLVSGGPSPGSSTFNAHAAASASVGTSAPGSPRMVPSYEGHFNAGLRDLEHRFNQGEINFEPRNNIAQVPSSSSLGSHGPDNNRKLLVPNQGGRVSEGQVGTASSRGVAISPVRRGGGGGGGGGSMAGEGIEWPVTFSLSTNTSMGRRSRVRDLLGDDFIEDEGQA